MRKDDPQINLRMPPDLKERIQQASKENHRTQTAEIIARLEESFHSEGSSNELLSAAKAKEIAAASILKRAKSHILGSIHHAVSCGDFEITLELSHLNLDLLPCDSWQDLITELSKWLDGNSYYVEWKDGDTLWIGW